MVHTLLYVEWVDSSHNSGWTAEEEALKGEEPLQCRSVGFLLRETKNSLVLVQSLAENASENKQVDAILSIPKVAITKRKRLARPA